MIEEYDVDSTLNLLAMARANEIDFGVEEERRCFHLNPRTVLCRIHAYLRIRNASLSRILRFRGVFEKSCATIKWELPLLRAALDQYSRDGTSLVYFLSLAEKT